MLRCCLAGSPTSCLLLKDGSTTWQIMFQSYIRLWEDNYDCPVMYTNLMPPQKWDIVGKTIVNRHSGRCLDIA